jgi:hypothetical protein
MSKPLISSTTPEGRLSTTQHMEGSCSKKIVIKREVKYPCTFWLMGIRKKQANFDLMAIFGHLAILLRGTLPYLSLHYRIASCRIKSTITPLEVRTNENNSIMNSSKEKQAIQATSINERHLIRGLTRSWWHSCTKVSPHCDKFGGKPTIHHLSQSLHGILQKGIQLRKRKHDDSCWPRRNLVDQAPQELATGSWREGQLQDTLKA